MIRDETLRLLPEAPRAAAVAIDAHRGQVDKAGKPYLQHPMAVAAAVETSLQKVVAMLHDVVEDCPRWTLERLRGVFRDDVVAAVDALTHRPGETRDAYYARVAADPTALVVKLADIAHNADPARLALIPDPEVRERLRVKYETALATLRTHQR